ncbi:MAG: magnesium transporter [Neomegalonema sp.]|nr:magnesium transporter [Neomegalonema sp.]
MADHDPTEPDPIERSTIENGEASDTDAGAGNPEEATAEPSPEELARKAAKKARKKAKRRAREHVAEAFAQKSFALDQNQIERVFIALETGDREALLKLTSAFHEADFADLLEQISNEDRSRIIEMLGPDLQAIVLSELKESTRDEVLEQIDPEDLASSLKDLDTDEVVYLVEDMEEEDQAVMLDNLEAGERVAVEQALAYPEYSAGRLMQREMVWAPAFKTVGEMIDMMRAAEDLPDEFYEIIIVDAAMKPIGLVPLSRVMGTRREVRLSQIMEDKYTQFTVDQKQEEVAYAFNQYHLISAPVVDENGRLVGRINIDDAMQALDEEAEEDLLRLGGVGDESLGDAVAKIAWRRFPWLAVNLATAILASLVIGLFDRAIEQVVALAVLMPIVASMGGNAGTQTLTVAVRALATKDLTATNAMRIITRETLVGLANGLAFAVVVAIIGMIWFGSPLLGLVLAVAMVVNMLVAGLAGILIPIGLEKIGADPALASAVFVTTVTDVVGFFVFLGTAVLILL